MLAMLLIGACSDPPSSMDAAVDAATDSAPPDSLPPIEPTEPTPVAAPAPPELGPCRTGWRAVMGPDFMECDPWPEGGQEVCGPDEAHFPGEAGCRRIGDACPVDGVPRDLPPDAIHVRAGATDGDGTIGAPFGTIAEALAIVGSDAVIGLAVGTYPEESFIRDPSLTIVGACTDTVIGPVGGTAFFAFGGTLTLRNMRIREATGGVIARDGVVNLDSIIFEDLTDSAVSTGGDASVVGQDLLVRRAGGDGVFLGGGQAVFDRFVLEDIRGHALTAVRAELHASSIAIDVVAGLSAVFVSAVSATVTVEGAVMTSDPLAMLIATDSSVHVADAVLSAPPGSSPSEDQVTVLALDASELELQRVVLTRPTGLAIGVGGTGSTAMMRDVVVREMVGEGHGIEIGDGAQADLGRVWVDHAGRNAMLFYGAGTTAVAQDLHVLSSQPDSTGRWGRGIGVQTGADLTADRVLLEEHHEVSLVVASIGTRAAFTDLTIRDTRERPCGASGCPTGGIGMGAYLGGSAQVERFHIEHNALLGFQVATGGILELADGVVSHNPIGVNIQSVEYDIQLLTDRVEYRDNGQNLDSTELFVPAPATL
ncbi:MAG: hypothetical protein DRJ42_01385 [Deltaproteobacteria bacterium]|nr:MAG: hypothetical protein DRJ42_01385 [Deltaproteobacteria bacterium]